VSEQSNLGKLAKAFGSDTTLWLRKKINIEIDPDKRSYVAYGRSSIDSCFLLRVVPEGFMFETRRATVAYEIGSVHKLLWHGWGSEG